MKPSNSVLTPFWLNHSKPGASEQELERAEEYVRQILPTELRTLLRERNGGVSIFATYKYGDLHLPFLPVFGVSPEPSAGTIMRAFDVRKDFGIPDNVVPFAGQGHSWWGLDYRLNRKVPGIIFLEQEGAEILVAAPSFQALLDGLVEE